MHHLGEEIPRIPPAVGLAAESGRALYASAETIARGSCKMLRLWEIIAAVRDLIVHPASLLPCHPVVVDVVGRGGKSSGRVCSSSQQGLDGLALLVARLDELVDLVQTLTVRTGCIAHDLHTSTRHRKK